VPSDPAQAQSIANWAQLTPQQIVSAERLTFLRGEDEVFCFDSILE
jgi:hypothetical protein